MKKSWQEVYNELRPIDQQVADHLGSLCEKLKPQRILEIGSGWGLSTRVFLQYAPTAQVITIDKIPADLRKNYNQRIEGVKENLIEIIGDSKMEVPKLTGSFDFIYIDGSHDYEDVITDLRNALIKAQHGATIVMDDVLHEKNIDDYGVLFAMRQFLMENRTKQLNISIALVGFGQAIIHL